MIVQTDHQVAVSVMRKLLHVIIYNNGEAPLAFSAAMRADSRS